MSPNTATLDRTVQVPNAADDFDLDVTIVELLDPAHLVSMTDDNCGESCAKSTCVSAV